MLKSRCYNCRKYRKNPLTGPRCDCGGIFIPELDFKFRDGDYRSNYPYIEKIISLGEVETPLGDVGNVSLKLEYYSPTFSYKDRGTRALISWLHQLLPPGSKINEDSSGNAGASISAYGTAAGFDVNIFIPEKTVQSKVNQISAYGARIHRITGSREAVSEAAEHAEGYFASHVLNPEFRDGMRQISYEIFRQNQYRLPDAVFIPVSAGTLLLGMISGFEHLVTSGEAPKVPEIIAVQTEAVSPLCSRLNGIPYDPNKTTQSIADALVSRSPPLLPQMTEAVSKYGRCITVSEEEIISARNELAGKGFLVEYSSATVYGAQKKMKKTGRAVLIMTGNGLKNL